jgi:microcystin-dependent protein
MPATTTEGTGHGSVEEIRRKIHNSLVREDNILPELLTRSSVFVPVGAVVAYGSSNAPKGWLSCIGQEVYRGDYPDLFAVIGTTYGVGNGTTTFNLPNLSGRVVVGQGTGSGLTARAMGATGGVEAHALNVSEMPSHSHTSNAVGSTLGLMTADGQNTAGAGLDASAVEPNLFAAPAALSIDSAGSGVAHNNMQPFAVLNYIIRYGNKN